MAKTLPSGAVKIKAASTRLCDNVSRLNGETVQTTEGSFMFDIDMSARYIDPNNANRTCKIALRVSYDPDVGDTMYVPGIAVAGDSGYAVALSIDKNGVVTFCGASAEALEKIIFYLIDVETGRVLASSSAVALNSVDTTDTVTFTLAS